MVNYYEILKVSPKASNAEIKSAYRRLARRLHPDKNEGSEEKAREFSKVAKAYEILGNPKNRAEYDRQRLRAEYQHSDDEDSVFSSGNEYAKRWRQMAYERRYNEIIDRMIADERQESVALQKIIFPLVGLFVSTFAMAVIKPAFFSGTPILLQIILGTLALVGVIHLFSRLREAFDRYTYDENIHDSILEDNVVNSKPYSRFVGVAFVVVGLLISLGGGLLIGTFFQPSIAAILPSVSDQASRFEFVFYPPIIVLCVDIMHSLASKFE